MRDDLYHPAATDEKVLSLYAVAAVGRTNDWFLACDAGAELKERANDL